MTPVPSNALSQLKHKNDLDACLSGGHQIFVSFSSELRDLPISDPVLLINNLGTILPLPFNPKDASRIATLKRCTHHALCHDEFEIQHSEWKATLSKVMADAANDLGIKGPVSAQNCRLVTCSQEASLELLENKKRSQHMVATLIILLPHPTQVENLPWDIINKSKISIQQRHAILAQQHWLGTQMWFSSPTPVKSGYSVLFRTIQRGSTNFATSKRAERTDINATILW